MSVKNLAAITGAALLSLTSTISASALDARYKDADGDMVADAPVNPAEFIDPSTLIFAYTPVEDPAVYAKVWDGFLKHMEKVTGKRVQFFPVQSNAAQIEAMRAGRLHVAGFNTGSNPIAVACAGFVPFTMMASKKDEFGYEMEIITYPGSGINKIEDIKGKKLAFTSETSNSGFKAPSALLEQEFKMVAKKDYEPVFSGKHDNSIIGVANKDYPAAAIANSVKARMLARNVVKADIEVCGGILHWVNTVFEPRDPVSNEIVNPRDPVSNEIVNPRDPVSNEIVNPRDPLPGAAPCSMAVLMSIMSATDPAAAVVELGTSDPPCAQCLGRCTDPATMQACGSACAIGGGR